MQRAERHRDDSSTDPIRHDGPVQAHADIAARRPGALEATLLRSRSLSGRSVLGHLATRGSGSLDDLLVWAEVYRDPAMRPVLASKARSLDPGWLLATARVLGLQRLTPDDGADAVALFRLVLDQWGRRVFDKAHAKLFAELLVQQRRFDEARVVLDTVSMRPPALQQLRIDLANPMVVGESNADVVTWLSLFNELASPAEEAIGLLHGGPTWFDALGTTGRIPPRDGPLVSVVMTTFNPGPELLTAVRAVVEQSWTAWELILVDDGSAPDHEAVLEQAAAMSDRVVVHRSSTNVGAYGSRNRALDLARGEFVTFHDSDDWSHPRRIERQVEALLADREAMGSLSACVRADERLAVATPGYFAVRPNASSLLFRRTEVMKRIGYFDTVRKAADSEYQRRMEIVFGRPTVPVLHSPLALVRLRPESLSRSDFAPGWHHKARFSYRMAYTHWHREIEAGRADPRLSGDPRGERAFAAPERFTAAGGVVAEPRSRHFDVVFVSEWRKYGGPQRSMIEEIAALHAQGRTIGVAHLEALRFMSRQDQELCAPLLDLAARGVVEIVLLDDSITTDLLIVRYPPVLQFPAEIECRWRARAGLVVANQAPYERDGSDHRYDVRTCRRHARRLFSFDLLWVPQGPAVREVLAPLVPPADLACVDLPGIIRVDEWGTDRSSIAGRPPRLGRYSRDEPMKFPGQGEQLLQAYPAGEWPIHIMGGTSTVPKLVPRASWPRNWVVTAHGSTPTRRFLDTIDFFVYFDHPLTTEAFGRSVLEAMASGCVTIVPPKFRATFGSGAVYVGEHEVASTVRWFVEDPTRFEVKSRAARSHVASRFGPAAFGSRLQRLAEESAARRPVARAGPSTAG